MQPDVISTIWAPTGSYRRLASRPTPSVRAREIAERDLAGVARLLAAGFQRPSTYYSNALARLARHHTPPGCPRFGYLIEVEERLVGAILLIFSTFKGQLRCNVTSWYVEPEYRSYASLFTSRAFQRKDVTYLNISARPAARPIIKAQGFLKFSRGQFVALPSLHLTCDSTAKVTDFDKMPDVAFDAADLDLLATHAEFGCTSLWCVTAEQAYPFVFLPRMFKRWMPGAQLIYCHDVKDLVRFARPLGRFLAARGLFLLSIDANEPLPNMIGIYLKGKSPRFFKGQACPRIGDLAYTQAAMFPWPELQSRSSGSVRHGSTD
jgi:hypothetical protein